MLETYKNLADIGKTVLSYKIIGQCSVVNGINKPVIFLKLTEEINLNFTHFSIIDIPFDSIFQNTLRKTILLKKNVQALKDTKGNFHL